MSGFLAAGLGYREFRSGDEVRAQFTEDQVRAAVARRNEGVAGNLYSSPHEPTVKRDPSDIRLMLLFVTPTQRSWLAVDRFSLFNVLDDLRKEEPTIRWLAKRTDAHPVKANYGQSPTSGILHLGTHGRDWLYSKDLFQDREVVDAVRQFIDADNT
jgi:hypothetical protein